jgi:hypothetical protein
MLDKPEDTDPATAIRARAQAIAEAGGLAEALAGGPRLPGSSK